VSRDPTAGLLFAGDHILPHITPSIGFEATPSQSPLAWYLESLRIIDAMQDSVLLFAHGPIAPSSRARVAVLLVHHD
jgi:glyoxylase-like metal-dependent hydrolase (beta-lactamase superfamily II)